MHVLHVFVLACPTETPVTNRSSPECTERETLHSTPTSNMSQDATLIFHNQPSENSCIFQNQLSENSCSFRIKSLAAPPSLLSLVTDRFSPPGFSGAAFSCPNSVCDTWQDANQSEWYCSHLNTILGFGIIWLTSVTKVGWFWSVNKPWKFAWFWQTQLMCYFLIQFWPYCHMPVFDLTLEVSVLSQETHR